MEALLVRVAADQSEVGGNWNGPVDSHSREFVYVPIPEYAIPHPGSGTPYHLVHGPLAKMGVSLPRHLTLTQNMHLDPDFAHLTYGDMGARAAQIRSTFCGAPGLLVFYAGLRDIRKPGHLVYAIIGLYAVESIVSASTVPPPLWHQNAHTRCVLSSATDIVVSARPMVSGRLEKCIPIGNYRDGAYRVFEHLLEKWGGLSVKNGYIQRSARLPKFLDAQRFYDWFLAQSVALTQHNN